MPFSSQLQQSQFAGHAGRVEAGAGPHALGQRHPGQVMHQQRGAGRVADAHLAQQQAIRRQAVRQRVTRDDGLAALLGAHRALVQVARRARRDLQVQEARRSVEVVVHARIDDAEAAGQLARQHRDGRATSEEVHHHLPGHILRIGRHAVASGPVVAGENQDVGFRDGGCGPALDLRHLHCQRLQITE